MLVCVYAGHSVAVIHDVSCPGSWFPGSWFLAGSYRSIRPFKPSILIPGAIVPNHTVRALVTPYSAVYGVSLVSRPVPWWWVALVWTLPPWFLVGCRPLVWRGVVGYCLQWGGVDGGYSPTIGVPLWWGAPYSGDGWIVGASPLLGFPDCGLVRIVGAYLLLKL